MKIFGIGLMARMKVDITLTPAGIVAPSTETSVAFPSKAAYGERLTFTVCPF